MTGRPLWAEFPDDNEPSGEDDFSDLEPLGPDLEDDTHVPGMYEDYWAGDDGEDQSDV